MVNYCIRSYINDEIVFKKDVRPNIISNWISYFSNLQDWQSRSTEDESFATASEGNFTPNSHSSSFQTASYIGSAKNSFDEADDSTLSNFEIPELPQSPVNMSFDSSELSYFSAQQQPPLHSREDDDDQDSVVGVAELHSQSVTPTPDVDPMPQHPIESDSEIEAYGLDSNGISTEFMPSVSTAVTPEVSSADCAAAASTNNNNSNNNEQKTTWRHSKYYENITKQTIKGFLWETKWAEKNWEEIGEEDSTEDQRTDPDHDHDVTRLINPRHLLCRFTNLLFFSLLCCFLAKNLRNCWQIIFPQFI